MKHSLTTTLSDMAYQFLISQAKAEKVNKNEILEAALKMYKRAKLKREIEAGLKRDNEELRQIASEFSSANLKRLRNL